MKKKIVMVLTGVAVCSLLMMGCQGKDTGAASDETQTEGVDPAADVEEPEAEPIPEATTEPEETEPEAEASPEATADPEAEDANAETNAEGTEDGAEADPEDAEGGENENASEEGEKEAE